MHCYLTARATCATYITHLICQASHFLSTHRLLCRYLVTLLRRRKQNSSCSCWWQISTSGSRFNTWSLLAMLGCTMAQSCTQIGFIEDRNMTAKKIRNLAFWRLNSTSGFVSYLKFSKWAYLDNFAPWRPHYLLAHQIRWSSRGLKLVLVTCKILIQRYSSTWALKQVLQFTKLKSTLYSIWVIVRTS